MTTALGSLVCIPENVKKKLLKNAINSNVAIYNQAVLVNQVWFFVVAIIWSLRDYPAQYTLEVWAILKEKKKRSPSSFACYFCSLTATK